MSIRFGRSARVSLLIVAFAVATSIRAEAQTPPAALPASSGQTILHLNETSERDVPRDLLRATLSAEASNPDAGKVQAEINQRMAAALVRIKQVPNITVETTGYGVYRDTPDKAPPVWHGSQSVTLTGKDFAALLGLVGTLQQQGLVTQNLASDLSRDARQSVEDALTNEALTRLRQRADRIATTLDEKVAGLRSVTVGNVNPPPPVFRAMAMVPSVSSSMAPPVAEPGSAPVSVTVEADIALAPR